MRWLLPVAAVAACAGPPQRSETAGQRSREASVAPAGRSEPDTRSPQPETQFEPLASECPRADAALGRVARWLAENWTEGAAGAEASEIEQRLREEGGPYVWPRAWTLAGSGDLRVSARSRLRAWLDTFHDGGERRCGVAVAERAGGQQIVAAVAIDALADLAAMPAHVRVGSWVEVQAEMLVPFNGAKVVVLGPRGAPRALPTAETGNQVRARFAADAEGAWLVQVLADVEHGPRPVLEALLMGGTSPRRGSGARPAPGEQATHAETSPDAALYQMLSAARRSEGLPPITREMRLDQLAAAQALALRTARRVAHDLGAGDPQTRVSASGLLLAAVGENVAHGKSVAHAHRALWNSPSHRSNILSPYFDSIGIGAAQDSDGSVWVCELFGRFHP
jgi:hypothetical protein